MTSQITVRRKLTTPSLSATVEQLVQNNGSIVSCYLHNIGNYSMGRDKKTKCRKTYSLRNIGLELKILWHKFMYWKQLQSNHENISRYSFTRKLLGINIYMDKNSRSLDVKLTDNIETASAASFVDRCLLF